MFDIPAGYRPAWLAERLALAAYFLQRGLTEQEADWCEEQLVSTQMAGPVSNIMHTMESTVERVLSARP